MPRWSRSRTFISSRRWPSRMAIIQSEVSRKLFEHADVMSTGGDGGVPILSRETEMVSPLAMLLNTATMEFFPSTFFSLIPERLDAARAFGSLAFFMRTKARRDRVMYLCRSTPFARGFPYLYKVFAFYFDHTLGTLFSQTQHLNICMGHSGTKQTLRAYR